MSVKGYRVHLHADEHVHCTDGAVIEGEEGLKPVAYAKKCESL